MSMKAKYSALWSLLKKANLKTWMLTLAVILTCIEVISIVMQPRVTQHLINQLGGEGFPIQTAIMLGILLIGASIVSGFNAWLLGKVGQDFVMQTRIRIYGSLLRVPVIEFERERAAEPASRLMSDAKLISSFVSMRLKVFISGFLILIGSIIQLWLIDAILTNMIFVCIALAFAIIVPLSSKIMYTSRSIQTKEAVIVGYLAEMFSQIRLLKVFSAERREEQWASEKFKSLNEENVREVYFTSMLAPVTTSLFSVALVVILATASLRLVEGQMTLGSLIAYIMYLFHIVGPVEQLTLFMSSLNKTAGAAIRLAELENIPHEKYQGLAITNGLQDISIQNLQFRYPDQAKDILNINSLQFPAGKVTAIVGHSGSGKSTLFTLLNRLYESRGIYYGDVDITDINLTQWRSKISNVAQDTPVLAGSVRFNLNYGLDKDASDIKCIESLKSAELWAFLKDKEGLDTRVGEDGVNLSGGQKQRLAIARAILHNPDILLLDEATSALDSATETAISHSLSQLMKGRTTIIATHRLHTMNTYDQIVMMSKGNVLNVGSHQYLLKNCPAYRDLIEQQMKIDNFVVRAI